MNIASDVYAWMWVVKLVIVLALLGWAIPDIIYLVKGKSPAKPKVRNICLKGIACLVALLALFVFFGPGKHVDNPDISEDGHRKIVEARPEPPTESAIQEEAKAKKDPYLKKVDASPEAAQKEADDYLKKALERSKNK